MELSQRFILRFCVVIVLMLSIQAKPAPAQGSGLAKLQNVVEVPFELTSAGNICFPVEINGRKSLPLMFHTASDSVTLTKEGVAKLGDLKFESMANVKSWGGSTTSRASANNKIKIAGLGERRETIFEDLHSAKGTFGKFGWHVFDDKAFGIDFAEKKLRIYNNLTGPPSGFSVLGATIERGSIFIEAKLKLDKKETIGKRFLLHSGFSGSVLLDDEFVKNHVKNRLQVTSTRELRDSFGNVMLAQKAELPGLELATLRLTNTPVEYFQGRIGDREISVLGIEFLRRFQWIFDTKNLRIYVRAVESKSEE